jgi:REP element-mobilizing transposase RayT
MKRYDVLAFQIMPDHVHILIHQFGTAPAAGCGGRKINIHRAQPAVVARPSITTHAQRNGFTISELMHGIKSYFAHQIYKRYGINYSVQQLRFYTRIVSTSKYLETVIQYIQHNPVKAELPEKYKKFPYQYFDWKLLRGL